MSDFVAESAITRLVALYNLYENTPMQIQCWCYPDGYLVGKELDIFLFMFVLMKFKMYSLPPGVWQGFFNLIVQFNAFSY